MDEPLYLKIYQSLKQDIENGVYKPGDQVPTEGGLADLFHVSKITSKRALNMLAEEGLLSRQKGRGTAPGHIKGILRFFTPKGPHQTFRILILPGGFCIQLHPFPILFLAAFVYQLSKPSCQNSLEAW